MKDFTFDRPENLQFKINDDIFYAVPRVGGAFIREIIEETTSLGNIAGSGADQVSQESVNKLQSYTGKVMTFLDMVLLPESQQRFAERLRSVDEPIELTQVYQVYNWLISEYSKRPTQPLLSSSNGHSGTGASLTAGVQAEE